MERAQAVRWLICAMFVLAFAPAAVAGDFDILRGPQSIGQPLVPRWSGFYFGGQFSESDGSADFSGATEPLLSYSLRNLELETDDTPSEWPILGKSNTIVSGYGGFIGYNTQWQDVVLGLEANYTHSPFSVTASTSPISREVTAGSNEYSVNLEGSGSLTITDYGTLRARAGWVFDNILPYGFLGLALGRANYAVTSLAYGQQNSTSAVPILPCDPATVATCVDYSFSNSTSQNASLIYGFSAGGGFDYAVTSNIFLRAEYEYIHFSRFAGIVATINTARVGAGLKF